MKKFCIIANSFKDNELEISNKIKERIVSNGGTCIVITKGLSLEREHVDYTRKIINSEPGIECAIVVGGDGTILQATKDLYGYDIPIIGINLGNVGFLAEVELDRLDDAIDKLMNDEYKVQNRIMLTGKIIRDGEVVCVDTALNDIVIGRFGISRVMTMEALVNDELINTYNGDGLIVSTPTGTTGYNLSAGGPIAKPDAKLLMITPICVHSLYNRSIVVSSEDKIIIRVLEGKRAQVEEAMATFDGRVGFKLMTNDVIEISQSDKMTSLIKLEEKQFFDIVREKIENK